MVRREASRVGTAAQVPLAALPAARRSPMPAVPRIWLRAGDLWTQLALLAGPCPHQPTQPLPAGDRTAPSRSWQPASAPPWPLLAGPVRPGPVWPAARPPGPRCWHPPPAPARQQPQGLSRCPACCAPRCPASCRRRCQGGCPQSCRGGCRRARRRRRGAQTAGPRRRQTAGPRWCSSAAAAALPPAPWAGMQQGRRCGLRRCCAPATAALSVAAPTCAATTAPHRPPPALQPSPACPDAAATACGSGGRCRPAMAGLEVCKEERRRGVPGHLCTCSNLSTVRAEGQARRPATAATATLCAAAQAQAQVHSAWRCTVPEVALSWRASSGSSAR